MEIDKGQQTAYLRTIKTSNQSDLTFHLMDSINGVDLNEEIRAVRKVTDTVASMLQHIENKLNKLIKTKAAQNEVISKDHEAVEIPMWFENNNKKIAENIVLKDLIESGTISAFYILKQKFQVQVNVPLVQFAILPTVIFANTCIRPVKYKIENTVRDLSIYEWYKSTDKENWTKIGDTFTYQIQTDDLNCYLKLRWIPRSIKTSGSPYEVISEGRVQMLADIPKCPFEERHQYTQSKLTDKEFRFVSYNILSPRYAHTNAQFPYCPNEFLSIDYRKHLLLKEIIGYKADIICLQELDCNQYQHFFSPKMKKFGYNSVFYKKGNKSSEGLGCFFNSKKFNLANTQLIVLSEVLKQNVLFRHIKQAINYGSDIEDILSKTLTSLQVTVLHSRILNQVLLIGNTHLYYHPDGSNIRFIQVALITAVLENLKKEIQQAEFFPGKLSVIFCGDLNILPTSEVFYYLTNGKLKSEHKETLKIINDIEKLTHPFHFESACGTPEYTNFTGDFKACLDYIFYEKENIKTLSFVPFPDESVLSQNTALPSQVFPSDHLALIADLRLL